MRRVLLTGASGFIGRHCVAPLSARGFEVHAVCNRGPAKEVAGAVWHCADLLEPGRAEALIDEIAPTHLLHLAWSFGAGGADPAPKGSCPLGYRWTIATLDMIRHFHARGGKRLVAAGTSFEYDWGDGLCNERTTPRVPTTFYGTCKNALGELIGGFSDHAGLSSAWARVFFLYGPFEPAARLVPSVIGKLLAGEPALCSHGNQVRDYLYIADVAEALSAILDSDVSGPVNIGSQQQVALKEIIGRIGDRLGRPDLIRLGAVPARANDAPLVLADTARLTREVGWRPRYDLDAGLDATIAWWRDHLGARKTSNREPAMPEGASA